MQTFWEWVEQVRTPEDILARAVPHEDGIIGRFRQVVADRLGDLAVLVLDVRLAGGEAASLVGCKAVGNPSRREVERAVRGITRLAKAQAASADDLVLLRIQRAMEEEVNLTRDRATRFPHTGSRWSSDTDAYPQAARKQDVKAEQRKHLTDRTQEVLQKNPALKPLLDLLLSHGGEFAVLHPHEEELEKILARGYAQSGRGAGVLRGERCRCHCNSADLWKNDHNRYAIVTGYALSEDGIWRQHTWLVDLSDGVHQRKKLFRIYETTERRVRYFGFQLTPAECAQFWRKNVTP
jgi:hypothetical protein